MRQNVWASVRVASRLFAVSALLVLALAAGAAAQVRGAAGNLVQIEVGDITLERIDFRDQTAHMSVGLDVSNGLIPVSLKDFDYRLRLFDQDFVDGRYDGTMKIGRQGSRIELPVVLNLRSVPNVVWNAFSNRGNVRYELDAGFTLPLFIFNKRVQANFDGEVPLRSLVDAATILRARNGGGSVGNGRSAGGILGDILRGGW